MPESRLRWIDVNAKAVGRVYGRNREDVEDLTQEASVKAFLVWRLRPEAGERFVVRCMHNHVKSVLRKAAVRAPVANTLPSAGTHTVDFDDSATDFDYDHDDPDEVTPHDFVVHRFELDEALGVLVRIPVQQREVFLAWATVGIPEYRRQTGMKKDRAYALLQMARASISDVLEGGDPNIQPALAL